MGEIDRTRVKEALSITVWGIAANLLLTAVKFIAGIMGRSSALVADAVHSLSDFVSDIVTIFGITIAGKPEDDTHDYGHGKYETIAIALIGMILFAAAIFILSSSVRKILLLATGEMLGRPRWITLYITMASILFKEILFQITIRKGKKLHSRALMVNAWHHRSDAFSSVAAFIGISGALLLGPAWRILDPLAAVIVAVFIVIVAVRFIRDSLKELVETSLDGETEKQIIEIVNGVEGVKIPHNLRTRQIGNTFAMDIHIYVEGSMNVRRAHAIANDVERQLKAHFGSEIKICLHIEPMDNVT